MRARQIRQGLGIGLTLVIAFWLVSLIWGLSEKAQIAIKKAHDAQREFAELEERKNTLQANLAALATDRGQDAAIRTALGVARPGEEVIVIVPPATATSTMTLSWWQKVLSWF